MNKQLKKQVEEILKHSTLSRNSDAFLTVKVWEKYYDLARYCDDCDCWNTVLELLRCAPPESIKRFRAMFQNDHHLYLPTNWEVAKQRRWQEMEWRRALEYSTLTPADHREIAEQEQHLRSISKE